MAMDVISVQYSSDCATRAARIRFALDIPVPPAKAEALKALMDAGDWNGFKAQAKAFAPLAISGALDFLVSAAPQKAAAKTPSPAPAPAPKPSGQ
ncbi:MAG: hypothetical protein NUV50_06750 [Rhodospirillales bacterium]|nr:hypothetical protein [Rhodospirillales bacterium]